MAELAFFFGTMDCGKSTLALQLDHNHAARGRRGLRFSSLDRAGEAMLSSRLGLAVGAIEVSPEVDLWAYVVAELTAGQRVDYLICDEAQFYTERQVEQLARVVDDLEIDVFAFGILTDFRSRLFPGSQRLVELSDRRQELQVEALCWCGTKASQNARTVSGVMVLEGEQVLVGDVEAAGDGERQGQPAPDVRYELLCRRHYSRAMTAHVAREPVQPADVLPFSDVAAALS